MVLNQAESVVVIGAGPAGLTAAHELTRHNLRPIVLEKYDKVGGIARTESYKGYYFDMGGHRFFTKVKPIKRFWREMLGNDFLRRPRLSRIFYRGRFFNYPLKPMNALTGLGLVQAVLIILSYIRWQLFPYPREDTFEQWVTNRFGRRLFEIFFKTYTEKVWGISCSQLEAEWAVQRIKDLSLRTVLLSMFVKSRQPIKTLIDEFHYPRRGPGMLWERVRERVENNGGAVRLNTEVVKIRREGRRLVSVTVAQDGRIEEIPVGAVISSMPVSEFIKRLEPLPHDVFDAAGKLTYRDFLTVCLIVDKPDLFPDNWIYVHSPEVKVGRIQNFKNWSPDMLPDLSKSSLGLEYFCTEGDETWRMSDTELIELGKREVERIGLARHEDVIDGCVFRVPKAYPIYDADYRDALQVVREFVDGLENALTIGRNGLHRYNNQDHSMLTAMLAVHNLVLGEKHDLWSVNADQAYHEEVKREERKQPDVASVFRGTLTQVFARMDTIAFGLAAGIVSGLMLWLATIFLVIKGGDIVGPTLRLLGQFLPGYTVTVPGGFVGLMWGFVVGFLIGSVSAYLRNVAVYLGAVAIHRNIEHSVLRRFLDFM